jgi:hypothetical protein
MIFSPFQLQKCNLNVNLRFSLNKVLWPKILKRNITFYSKSYMSTDTGEIHTTDNIPDNRLFKMLDSIKFIYLHH